MQGSPGTTHYTCSNQGVLVNEINYKSSADTEAGDWIELHNTSSNNIDLSGWIFKDENDLHVFTFPANTIIKGKDYLVLYNNDHLFSFYHTNVTNKIGPFTFGLGNNDVLRLFDNTGKLHFSMNYYNAAPFPIEADGGEYTLNLNDTLNNMCDGNNWIISCLQGSPGASCTPESIEKPNTTSSINIYPIPANNYISINFSNTNQPFIINIYSMLGKQVYAEEIIANTNSSRIKIQQLNQGIYFIELVNKNTQEKYTKKFVKERE